MLPPPAYDEKGNLYVQPVVTSSSNSWVCDLLAKGRRLEKVAIFQGRVDLVDNAIWDGAHIALVDAEYNGDYATAIYQTKVVTWGGVKVIGTTLLPDACHGGNNEIKFPFVVGKKNTAINHERGTVVIGSNIGCQPYPVEFWRYPQGGQPVNSIPLKFRASGRS